MNNLNLYKNIYFIDNILEFETFLFEITKNSQDKNIIFIFDKIFFLKNKNFLKNFFIKLNEKKIKSIFLLKIKSSEKAKSFKTFFNIIKVFIRKNIKNDDIFFFFGGGVILDIAGFLSTTYKRGLKNVFFIPTTLISIIDASIGGKNSLNFYFKKIFKKTLFKNIIGSFFFDYNLIIFPHFLKTLDYKNFLSGFFEIIKYGIIENISIIEKLNSYYNNSYKDNKLFYEIIKNCIEIKLKIINKDPFDKNERKKLNFGHTFGHALEDFNIPHGYAVGFGMIFELLIIFEKNNYNINEIFSQKFYNIIKALILNNYSFLLEKLSYEDYIKTIYFIFNILYNSNYKKFLKIFFNPFYKRIKKGENIFPLNNNDLIKIFNLKLQKKLIKYFIHDKKL